jgi:hypothetical protein
METMLAIVIFLDSNDVNRGSAELIEHGFNVQYLNDWIDDDFGRPRPWVNVWTLSDLDNDSFYDWVQDIVQPVGGYVYGVMA